MASQHEHGTIEELGKVTSLIQNILLEMHFISHEEMKILLESCVVLVEVLTKSNHFKALNMDSLQDTA